MSWKDEILNDYRDYIAQEPPPPIWYRVWADRVEVYWSTEPMEEFPSGTAYREDGTISLLWSISDDLKRLEL